MGNSDEIKSAITTVLITIFGSLATKYGIDGSTMMTIASALATLAVFVYKIYDHWGQKKVPEASVAVVLPQVAKDAIPGGSVLQKGDTINLTPLTGEAKVVG